MADQPRRGKERVDSDGVRVIERAGVRPRVWLLTLAMVITAVALFVVFRPALQQALSAPPQAPRSDVVAHAPMPRPTVSSGQVPQRPAAPERESRLPGAAERRVEPAAAAKVDRPADEVHSSEPSAPAAAGEAEASGGDDDAAGEAANQPSGIALFPPPGTKPIKRGIVVPEGVELPPGYVRHYQTTDDGRQLPPILMFHPDYQPVDAKGEPVALPEDRVVPPEMAPAGIPVQILDVPEPQREVGARPRGQREAQ